MNRLGVLLTLSLLLVGRGVLAAPPSPVGDRWASLASVSGGQPSGSGCVSITAPSEGDYVEIAQCSADHVYPDYTLPGECSLFAVSAGSAQSFCASEVPGPDGWDGDWLTVSTDWHWRSIEDNRAITVTDATVANWGVLSAWAACFGLAFLAKSFAKAGDY